MFTEEEIGLMKEFYFHCLFVSLQSEERTAMWSHSLYTYETMEKLILGNEEDKIAPHPPWLYFRPKYRTHSKLSAHVDMKRKMFVELKRMKKLLKTH